MGLGEKIRDFFYRLSSRINLLFVKHSLLDMRRDKAKTFFGISGIAISLFLLTAVGMLNDTMSYNYVKMITTTTGQADIMITKTIKTDITFDPFFDESIIDEKLQNIEGVEQFFPRIMMLVKTSSDKTTKNGSLEMYGIDFKAEAESGRMGDLLIVDDTGNETGEVYEGEPAYGECVILWNVAKLLNVTKGDIIHLQYQQYTADVKVIEICVQDLKFMDFENALIIVNIEFAQEFLHREGQINFVYGVIDNPNEVYDASNIRATTRRLREIGTRIQERLDLNEYSVYLPKLEQLEGAEYLLMGTTIIFWFITLLSMLITGILINSILTTSAEERVREFGICRVVGGRKTYPLKIVVFEGILLGVFGSVIGFIIGYFATPPIARTIFASLYNIEFEKVEFVIHLQTVLIALIIGIGVSFVVSLLPALRAAKVDIIKSITPFQTKEEGWEVAKEGSMNVKSFLVGISIATVGMIIFVLLPRILVTGDTMLIVSIFVGLLAAILIGLVFASVGVIPLVQKLFLGTIRPAIKRYYHIIGLSLKRYRRRNTSTVVMFAISFSFIFFITSINEMESDNFALNLKFQYGADLVIVNQGLDPEENAVTLDMVDDLKTLEGIDQVAYALHNTFDIQAALSVAMDFSEGGIGFEEDNAQSQMMSLFEYYQTRWAEEPQTVVGDIVGHDETQAGFIGIDRDFLKLVDKDLLIWKSSGSGFNYSFTQLFQRNDTCIISKAIASVIGVEDVGEKIRLTFYNPQKEDDPGNITILEVVGISGGIPGFWNFRSNEYSAYGGGVMVSIDNYARLMHVKNAGEPDMIIDKIFINLRDNSEENIKKVKDEIRTLYKGRNFIIDDAISKINYIEEENARQNALMEIILMFTVIICIFGLISSMYAVMLERKFEIGILRSMGLKSRNIRNMFLTESLIIMLSAGIMGTIIGSFCAYLMQTNLGLITEMPVIFDIPMDTLIRVFVISVSVGVIGMYVILWRFSRLNIMEIFRQSF
ncbi:MAG: ABC transporter permease [Promethearchaeota archaeon]